MERKSLLPKIHISEQRGLYTSKCTRRIIRHITYNLVDDSQGPFLQRLQFLWLCNLLIRVSSISKFQMTDICNVLLKNKPGMFLRHGVYQQSRSWIQARLGALAMARALVVCTLDPLGWLIASFAAKCTTLILFETLPQTQQEHSHYSHRPLATFELDGEIQEAEEWDVGRDSKKTAS